MQGFGAHAMFLAPSRFLALFVLDHVFRMNCEQIMSRHAHVGPDIAIRDQNVSVVAIRNASAS